MYQVWLPAEGSQIPASVHQRGRHAAGAQKFQGSIHRKPLGDTSKVQGKRAQKTHLPLR